MIESRRKNQKMAINAIEDFIKENKTFPVTIMARNNDLIKFVKFLSQRMAKRTEDNDCYFLDMLEDLERIE